MSESINRSTEYFTYSVPIAEQIKFDAADSENETDGSNESVNEQAGVSGESSLITRVTKHIMQVTEVSALLRVLGVGAVVLSMFLYLVSGLELVNDEARFHSMLAFTGFLSIAGLLMSFVLKEQKGSRAFFNLAAISVPVNFSVLGAMLYAMYGIDRTAVVYPGFAEWTANNAASLAITGVLSSLFLVFVTFFSFSIMSRVNRNWLTVALMASSVMLLIPLRTAAFIVPLVACMFAALAWMLKRVGKDDVTLKTPSGMVAKALLFLPGVIMLGRSFWLYGIDNSAALVVSLMLFAFALSTAKRCQVNTVWHSLCVLATALSAFISSLFAASLVDAYGQSALFLASFNVVLVLLVLVMQKMLLHSPHRQVVIGVATLVLSVSAVFNDMVFGSLMANTLSIVILVSIMTFSLFSKYKASFNMSAIALGLMLLMNGAVLFSWISGAGWWMVAIIGIAAISIASVLERYGPALSMRLRSMPNSATDPVAVQKSPLLG